MKKKNYITPETNEIIVRMESHMLAGSGEMNSSFTIDNGTDEDDEM